MNERCEFEREIAIENGGSEPIYADLRTDSPEEALPLIILCHGFLGYKRWGWYPLLSRAVAKGGFHALTISFSMNGTDERTGLITEAEEFASNTISREIEDLANALLFVQRCRLPVPVGEENWGLFGHSRGGAVAILVAPRFPEVKSLVTWSTPSRLDRYTDSRKEEWKKSGKLVFRDPRADKPLHLNYSYYRDIDANRDYYDLPKQASKLKIPHLIVHGRRDAAVTLKDAEGLISLPREEPVKFEVIEGCGHTFGVKHPMKFSTRELEAASRLTLDWFERTVQGKVPL